MNDHGTKKLISFTKPMKQIVRKGHALVKTQLPIMKPHSTSKSNLSKNSQRLKSKEKRLLHIQALTSQPSPYYYDGNNANSQRCKIGNQQSGKPLRQYDCWSIQTSVETRKISKGDENSESRSIRKERSCRQMDKFDKKDRKFSQNIHKAVHDYQNIKEQHVLERKIMEMALNERQLHRLNKIYAVEESQYMIRVLNAEKK